MGNTGSGYVEEAFEIGVDESVPIFICNRSSGYGGRIYARAVEYMVDVAVLLDDGINEVVASFRGTNVKGGDEVVSLVTQ